MKNFYPLLSLLFVLLLVFIGCEPDGGNEPVPQPEPEAEIIHIPDEHFKNALLNSAVVDTNDDKAGNRDADLNNDGEIQRTEAEAIEGLILHFDYGSINRYVDLSGIEHFINLKVFKVTGEGGVYDMNKPEPVMLSYDFRALNKLEFLQVNQVASNYFEIIDLRGLNNLVELDLGQNRPTWYGEDYGGAHNFIEVKMQGLVSLTKMGLVNSFLLVDFCETPGLVVLDMRYLEGGEPDEFDFHCLTKLEWLDFSENIVKSLILKNSSVLKTLVTNGVDGARLDAIYYPLEYVCIDDIEEEWEQINSLIDENTVVTTDCTF